MKTLTHLILGSAVLALAACGNSDIDTSEDMAQDMADTALDNAAQNMENVADKLEDADTSMITEGVTTKAGYIRVCVGGGIAESKCNCLFDFYESNGLSISDLVNEAKMTEFTTNLSMPQMTEMASCMS